MSVAPRQSIFKIVSLTKHQPIFLLKNGEGRKGGSQGEMMVESARKKPRNSLKSVKEEICEISQRIGLVHASSHRPHLDQRSQSCDLRLKPKGRTETKANSGDDNQSSQRTMKQYLRLAYRRAQLQRKLNGYKLPALIKSPNPQKDRNDDESALRPHLKYNRLPPKQLPAKCKILRKGRIFDPFCNRSILAKPDAISGWDGDLSLDDL